MKNIQVIYEKGAEAFAVGLFGRAVSAEELAAAVGALDGSLLKVRVRKGSELAVEVEHVGVSEQTRFIRRDAAGELSIWNFRFEKAPGSYGVGLASLLRQLKGARALGIKQLECYAAGNINDNRYNGYFRWAQYGFDAPLDDRERAAARQDPRYTGVTTVNEVFLRGGREWWRTQGSERKMVFVLAEGSSMMQVLRQYLEQHHPELLSEL